MTRRRWIADTWSPQSGHPTHAALTGEQALLAAFEANAKDLSRVGGN